MWKRIIIVIAIAFLATAGYASNTAFAAGCDPGNIIFSEIDYDQPGTDNAEFLELRILNAATISSCDIRLVNGNGTVDYRTLDISGSWSANQYLLIGGTNIVNRDIAIGTCSTDCIQNGAPDGFALVDTSGGAGTVMWFYSYEGTITGYDAGDGTLVNSTNLPVSENNDSPNRSLVNGPVAGVDDTTTTTNPTPGAANQNDGGGPTAVTLSTLSATGFNPTMLALALAALLAIGAGVFVLRRRSVL